MRFAYLFVAIILLSCGSKTSEKKALTPINDDLKTTNGKVGFLATAKHCYQDNTTDALCSNLKLRHHESLAEAYLEAYVNPDLFFKDGKLMLDDPFAMKELRADMKEEFEKIEQTILNAPTTNLIYQGQLSIPGQYDFDTKSFKGVILNLNKLKFSHAEELKSTHSRIYWSVPLTEDIRIVDLKLSEEKAKKLTELRAQNPKDFSKYEIEYDLIEENGKLMAQSKQLRIFYPGTNDILVTL